MKKKELKNGDIVMMRSGELGIYLADQDAFIYQECGYDTVDDMFEDDLVSADGEGHDVMRVYREPYGNVISFYDYEEGDLIFERDEAWERPSKEEREAVRAAAEAAWKARMEELASANKPMPERIGVMVQGFYGNRTATQIEPEKFDALMLGYIDTSLFDPEKEDVDRTIIRVPDSDGLVFVYNKYQEAERLRELQDFIQELHQHKHRFNPTVVVPELNTVLYSRVIVCRMNAGGELKSLEEGDQEKLLKYLCE